MKKSKYSEEQIATALRQVDAGAAQLKPHDRIGVFSLRRHHDSSRTR